MASVSLSVPSQVMIGRDFSFTATFANTSGETGYGPIIDLILPTNGADGNGNTSLPLDGIAFLSATYLGAPVTAVAQIFPGTGITPTMVTEPYTFDPNGQPLPVYGTPGDTLVSLQLPFGSFTPGQPPAPVTISAHLSDYANPGVPLTILARGGYEYGATALNDWCCGDPTIVSPETDDGSGWPSASTSPTIMTASKSNNAPEGETATGPNFPRNYSLSVNIAPGQTITNFQFIDTLPNSVQYQGGLTSSPAYITATEPITTAPQNSPTSTLQVAMSSISNTASAGLTFFVPMGDANGNYIVNPSTGACATTTNPLDVSGTWTPLDPRDAPTVVTATLSPGNLLSDCAIVVQKSVTDVTHPGAPSPLDTVQYSLNFQISDYFAFQDINLQDFLPDGIHFDSTFTPTLTITAHGNPSSGDMSAANYPVTDHWTGAPSPVSPVDGTTEINFHVSDEMVARGLLQVLGGCVPDGGTRGADPDCSTYNGGPTTATIVFRGQIQTNYTDIYPGSRNVYLGDTLNNTVAITGTVLNNIDLTSTGNVATNGSSASVTISSPALTKSVYAINGTICDPCANPHVGPGDNVTYRIKYQLPSAFYHDQTFTDFLPLPIYDATTVVGPFDTTITSTVPAAGQAHFGPAETLFGVTGITPTITTNASGNSVTFAYGSFADTQSRDLTTDILFSVAVKNLPFADGLYLTNQVQAVEDNHSAQVANSIVQVQLGEPLLLTTKSVIASTNPNAVFSPAVTGPVTFTVPGTSGARWSGVINSTNLAANPINSNVSGVDANDLLSFALVIQNGGASAKGAFDIVISDTLPTGFITPTNGTGLNLRVSYGDATGPISYTLPSGLPASPGDLFGAGIKLVDPSSTQGVCQAHSLANGLNIVIVTYDLQVASDIPPNLPMTNTGALVHYAGDSGGPNFLSAPQPMTSTVTTAPPLLAKTIVDTNQAFTSGTNIAVGEIITYSATITVPEGITSNVVLTDTLSNGLAFVTNTVASSLSSGLTMSGSATPTITNGGKTATFSLGDLTNSNNNAPISATLTLTYPIVALDAASNTRGATQSNGVTMTYDGGSASAAAPNLTIVEPTLSVSKSANPTTGDAGDVITYTLNVMHTGASNSAAFDVVLTDTIPSGVTFTGYLANTSGVAPDSLVEANDVITATWSTLSLGQGSQIRFAASLDDSVAPAQRITNRAYLAWTSLPGDVTTAQSAYASSSTERTGDASNPGGALNNYRASGATTLTTKTPTIDKLAPSPAQYTIGATIPYTICVTLPEGVTSNLMVTDTLPSSLTYVNGSGQVITDTATVSHCNAAYTAYNGTLDSSGVITSGQNVRVSFSSDPQTTDDNDGNNNTFVFALQAIVLNDINNQDGRTRSNNAQLTFTNPNDGSTVTVNSTPRDITIIEPALAIDKFISGYPMPADAGGWITYTVNISHAVSSHSPAYDVVFTDTIPTGLIDASVVDVSASGITAPSSQISGGVLRVPDAGAFDMPMGSVVTVTFQAQLDSTVTPDQTVTNTGNVAWTSMPGVNANEREYASSAEIEPESSVSFTMDSPTIGKAIAATSLADTTGSSVTIGEAITYSLAVTLTEGTTPSLIVTDTLPAGLSYVAGSAITDTAGFNGTLSAMNTTTATNQVIFTFDDPITVVGDNDPTNNTFGILFQARVANVVGNQSGVTLPNSATMQADTAIASSNTVTATIVAPQMNLAKTMTPSSASPNDPIAFTLYVTNTGTSAAYDVAVSDTLSNAQFVSIAEGSTPSGFIFSAMPSGGDTIAQYTGGTLAAGSSATFSFNAVLASGVTRGTIIANTATVTGATLPGFDANERSVTANGSANLTVIAPDISVAKSDGRATITPGVTTAYAITVTNSGTRDATGVVLTDTIPAHTTFVGASGTFTNASGTLTWAPFSLATGLNTTRLVTVTVSTPLPAGTNAITNTARAVDDSTHGVDTTPSDNTAADADTINAAPVLSLFKSDGGATTTPGGVVTYTLTYSNTGDTAATGVGITDTVPANMTFDPSASTPGWMCSPNDNAGSTCTLTLGTLAGNSGANNVTFVVAVSSALPAGTTQIANTAYISDDAGHTASSSDTTPVRGAQPEVGITKTHSGTTATASALITYTLRYTNTGSIGASNVLISETVPANTTFAGPPSTWSCNIGDGAGTQCLRNIGVLNNGSGSVGFVVRVNSSLPGNTTTITNTVSVSDDGTNGPDSNPGNNTYTDTIPVTELAPALAITKSANVAAANPGSVITYTLHYTNTGDADATGVVMTETVPANTTFTGAGWTCQPNNNAGSACTRAVGTLAAGGGTGTGQFVVSVASPLPGVTQIANSVTIADDSSHSASATVSTPTQQASPTYLYLPLIQRIPLSVPPPTNTPTPTPIRPILDPKGMVSDGARDRLYLVNKGDNSVVVFEESTLTSQNPTVLSRISVGPEPFGIGVVDDKIYVANSGGSGPGSVSVISAATMTKLRDISLNTCGNGAAHLAVNPNTHRVYTALHSSGKVAVIDSTSDSLVGCVTTNAGAFGIAVHPASNSIFVGNRDGLDLTRIDGNTNIATQVVNWRSGSGGSPYYVGINLATNLLFAMVGLPSSNVPDKLYVYSIDATGNLSNQRIASVGNTDDGGFVLQSRCSNLIYIAETADDDVRILNPDLSLYGVVTRASGMVDQGPFGLLENPTLKRIYVSNKPANTLKVLSECTGSPAPVRASPSPTPTNTSTPTLAPTKTLTPTVVPSVALAPTKTPAPVAAPSSTPTPSKTPTDVPLAAITPTKTPAPVAAPSSTPTPSKTPAIAPTSTPAPSSTPTLTSAPTNTPANTATLTRTPTLPDTPTLTATETITATGVITRTK